MRRILKFIDLKKKNKWIINYCIDFITVFMHFFDAIEKGVNNNDETFQWLF